MKAQLFSSSNLLLLSAVASKSVREVDGFSMKYSEQVNSKRVEASESRIAKTSPLSMVEIPSTRTKLRATKSSLEKDGVLEQLAISRNDRDVNGVNGLVSARRLVLRTASDTRRTSPISKAPIDTYPDNLSYKVVSYGDEDIRKSIRHEISAYVKNASPDHQPARSIASVPTIFSDFGSSINDHVSKGAHELMNKFGITVVRTE